MSDVIGEALCTIVQMGADVVLNGLINSPVIVAGDHEGELDLSDTDDGYYIWLKLSK
jgi:hypothetical protein